MRTAMVHQLYQLEKVPRQKCLVPHKNDTKTQQYNSVELSELKSGACMSALNMSVYGQHCLAVVGGFWLSKMQGRVH